MIAKPIRALELHYDSVFNNRPYSRYSPSLHVLYDSWDKSNVTWYFRGEISDKICHYKKWPSNLSILLKSDHDVSLAKFTVRVSTRFTALTVFTPLKSKEVRATWV